MTAKRPALRYHGGKWLLAPWIISHFPSHRIYTEVYGGAASVLIQKQPAYSEIYNDLDGELVNVFRVLRNPTQSRELYRLLKLTPFAREEFENAYLPGEDPVEQARRTIIRSFMGFGSDGVTGQYRTGFRANANRSGTTPAHDWANYADVIPAFTERLCSIIIESRPATQVLIDQDRSETLHYVDPPYPLSTRSERAQRAPSYRHEMTDNDHREMAAVLHSLKGMVVLSGYPCDLYDIELFPSWRRIQRKALADGARERTEVLWLNPAAARHQGIMEVS